MIQMTEILNFIKWQVRQWKWHDYLWMSACFMISFDFTEKGVIFSVGITLAAIMVIGALIKWQWNAWKREREDLLKTIKEGK